MLVQVLGKGLHGSCPLFLPTMFKRCLVKQADSGRKKELEKVSWLWKGSCVSYASLPKDKSSSELATQALRGILKSPGIKVSSFSGLFQPTW